MSDRRWFWIVLMVVVGCGTDPIAEGTDAGEVLDSGESDLGSGPVDMGSQPEDMGSGPVDMEMPPADMGTPPQDMAGPDAELDAEAADMSMADAGEDAGTACDQTGFAVTSSSVNSIGSDLFTYEAVEGTTTDANYRTIDFSIFPEDGGTIAVQGFNFTGESYADCGLCLLAYACTQAGCGTTLMAQSGTVDISAIGTGPGDAFAAEFRDVVFQEVTIDSGTFATTLVPGGLTWCVPSLSASGTNVAN